MTSRYNPAQVSFTSRLRTLPCPHCTKHTTLTNYRHDALRGKTVIICEHCHNVLPRGV